jgi:NADH dehydrogenase FAD-containing subunit
MLPEVLPTVNAELGALVHAELDRHQVGVHTRTTVTRISRDNRSGGGDGRLHVEAAGRRWRELLRLVRRGNGRWPSPSAAA